MADSESRYLEEYDIVDLIGSIEPDADTNSDDFRFGSTENDDRDANPIINPNQSHLVFTGSNYVEVGPSYKSSITLTMDNCCVPAPAAEAAQVEAEANISDTTDSETAPAHTETDDVDRDAIFQISAPNIIAPESLTSSISIVVCQLCRKKFVSLGFLVTHMEVAHQVIIHNKKEDLSLQIPGAGEPVKRESGVWNSNITDVKTGPNLNLDSDSVPVPVPVRSNLSHRVSPMILSKKSSADRDRAKVHPLLFPHPSPPIFNEQVGTNNAMSKAPIYVHVYPSVPTFELTTSYLDQAIDVDASPRRKQILGRVKTPSSNTNSSSSSVEKKLKFGPFGSGDFAKPRDPKQRRCSSGAEETVKRGIQNEVGFRFRCDICSCPLSTQDALDRHKFRCEFMHSKSDDDDTMTN